MKIKFLTFIFSFGLFVGLLFVLCSMNEVISFSLTLNEIYIFSLCFLLSLLISFLSYTLGVPNSQNGKKGVHWIALGIVIVFVIADKIIHFIFIRKLRL